MGVPRGKSTSNLDMSEIGDKGEDVFCLITEESESPCEGPVVFPRLRKLPDLDMVVNVFEAAGEVDPNMSPTEKEWRDRCFFFAT